jgi:hypothetical protein
LKILDHNDRKDCSKETTFIVTYCSIFIASILLVGSALQATVGQFPGHMLAEVNADTVTGTDGDDKLEGTDDSDDTEGKGLLVMVMVEMTI